MQRIDPASLPPAGRPSVHDRCGNIGSVRDAVYYNQDEYVLATALLAKPCVLDVHVQSQ